MKLSDLVSDEELLKEAIEVFGKNLVHEVLEVVYLADADGAYSTFQDMGMDDHAECVEMLFFG
jgi:hypothetical protein